MNDRRQGHPLILIVDDLQRLDKRFYAAIPELRGLERAASPGVKAMLLDGWNLLHQAMKMAYHARTFVDGSVSPAEADLHREEFEKCDRMIFEYAERIYGQK